MRSSNQRSLILDIVNTSTDHLNIDQIYIKAREIISNISLGTVYRNVNKLVEDNKIMRIKTNEGLDRFDNVKIKHHHFICSKCHKIIDVFEKVDFNFKTLNNNVVDDYEIKLKGICGDCLKEGGK